MKNLHNLDNLENLFFDLGKIIGKFLASNLKNLELGADEVYQMITVLRDALVNEIYPHVNEGDDD